MGKAAKEKSETAEITAGGDVLVEGWRRKKRSREEDVPACARMILSSIPLLKHFGFMMVSLDHAAETG